jgi:hypothetical protein
VDAAAPGMQTIRVIGVDAAGNSAVATANVMVNAPADTTPPTVSVAVPTFTGVSTSTTLAATAQANAAALPSCSSSWMARRCAR